MCIHAPGSLSFVCLLIRPRPGTYGRSRCDVALASFLVTPFGFVSAGWDTVGRMGGPSYLPSERPFGHAHAGSPVAYGLLDSCLPANFGIYTPPLWFTLCFTCFLPRSPGFVLGPRFSQVPSGHAWDPENARPPLWPLGWFGVVCGGTVGLVRSLVRWGRMQPLQLCLPPSRLGSPFLGGFLMWWRVREVAFGCGSDYFFGLCGVAVSRYVKRRARNGCLPPWSVFGLG